MNKHYPYLDFKSTSYNDFNSLNYKFCYLIKYELYLNN